MQLVELAEDLCLVHALYVRTLREGGERGRGEREGGGERRREERREEREGGERGVGRTACYVNSSNSQRKERGERGSEREGRCEGRGGAYSAGSLGPIEHVLITCHLPYCHDNFRIASVPGVDGHWTKTAFLVSPKRREMHCIKPTGFLIYLPPSLLSLTSSLPPSPSPSLPLPPSHLPPSHLAF